MSGGLLLDRLEFGRPGFRLGPLSFAVEPGSLTAVIGPNGAGKTTLLRAIAGFVRPKAGRIQLDGEELTALPPEQRHLAWVPAGLGLLPHRDALGNVRYPLDLRGAPRAREEAERWMRRLGILALARRFPAHLSDGERQRVALARALASAPRLLLLDEPTASLDANGREELIRVVRELLATEKVPALLVAHDAATAISLADRALLLHHGEPWYEGPLETLADRPIDVFSARFFGFENVWGPEELGGTTFDGRATLLWACGPEGVAAPSSAFLVGGPETGSPGTVRALRAGGKIAVVDSGGLTVVAKSTGGARVSSPGATVGLRVRKEELRGLSGMGVGHAESERTEHGFAEGSPPDIATTGTD
jgi:ABC-type sulfate/molybdate transport systems ATPase subunit